MARPSSTAKAVAAPPKDLNDLLDPTPDDEKDLDVSETAVAAEDAPPVIPVHVEETPAQRRIRELKEQIDATPAGPSEEELEIKRLEDQLARKQGAAPDNGPTSFEAVEPGSDTILLHFVADGLVACGQTWFRGQELEFVVGGQAYKQQLDRNGNSWLDLIDDIDGQFERYGEQKFARGPWRGKKWGDPNALGKDASPEEIAAFKKAAEAERVRNRAAPLAY